MKSGTRNRTTDWREARRIRGWELSQKGWSQVQIAEALGVTQGAVSQWLKRGREGGIEALRRKKAVGPACRLDSEQLSQIPLLLAQGAESHGFRGDIWTCDRIAKVIQRSFGVSYHPAHVSRLLKQCGWSLQKPRRRASQRDDKAIEHWVEEEWPEIKKRPVMKTAP